MQIYHQNMQALRNQKLGEFRTDNQGETEVEELSRNQNLATPDLTPNIAIAKAPLAKQVYSNRPASSTVSTSGFSAKHTRVQSTTIPVD